MRLPFQDLPHPVADHLLLVPQMADIHAEDAIKKVSVPSNDLAKREDEFDIVEGDTHHSACSVFYEALNWFEAFLRDDNIFPEEPFVGPG